MLSAAAVRGVLVSATLEGFRNSVNSFIAKEMPEAGAPSINPQITAARDVGLAVQNALVAYDYPGTLKLAVDKVDAVVAKQLETLRTMVSDLESKSEVKTENLTSRVQEFIHSLFSGSEYQPKVLGVWPRNVFILQDQIEVSFSGLFDYAAKYPKGTELVLQGHIFRPNRQSTADRLYFNVTLGDWCPISRDTFKVYEATLKVPYHPGMLRTVLSANYQVYIGTYPASPGQIQLTYFQSAVAKVDERVCRSPTFVLSRSDFGSTELIERQLTVLPSPGWKIAGTPQIHSQGAAVDLAKEQYTTDQASVTLRLQQGEDKAESHVEFKESQDVMEDKEFTPEVQLKWNEGFGFSTTRYRLRFKAFDGKEYEYADSDETKNPYLNVIKMLDGSYRLVSSNPKQ